MTTRRVLLIEDDASVREALAQTLELADCDAVACSSFVMAKDHITPDWDGVILSDMRMPGRDGFHVLEFAQGVDRDLPVILLTGEGDIPMAVRAMGMGAFGFLEKPCAPSDLMTEIERGLRTRGLVLENRQLRVQLQVGDPAARLIFGTSDLSEGLRGAVRRVAQLGADVLVSGAPGTGISKVAEVIHLCSARARAPFEKRAAAGLDSGDLAELLEKGAGGTVFLDEVGQMPRQSQLELVDAMERGAGLCVIAGSSGDLAASVAQGQFNADLYYRLEATLVRVPSLNERPEDIPVLFQHYVAQACEQAGLSVPVVTPELITDLMARDWPGNARALMSTAMRFAMGDPLLEPVSEVVDEDLGLAERLARVEKRFLMDALRENAGQASAAAKRLKLPRKTFYDKLARHGLKPEDYRV